MKLLIDDANVRDIRRLIDLYPIDGVTTNPSILLRAGGDPARTLGAIRALVGDDRLIFAQVIARDAGGMVRDARAIVKLLGENTVAKVPAIPEGFKAIRILKGEGIRTCGTVVYAPMQAYLAAKAGADYTAPYVNRIDNLGYDGVGVVKQIQDILTLHRMPARVLAASFKNSRQVLELCAYGIANATCAPAVIDALVQNPAVDAAVDGFIGDFERLAGPGTTMADLP